MISLAQRQDYLRAAPLGIDVDFARTQRGGLGTRVNIADIEYGWDRDHEDFPSTSRILFDRVQRDSDAAHGTAVIGILWAEDNGFGVTGIVPEARIGRVSPYFDTPKGKDIRDVGAAMLYAADRMEIGDIILLEQQAPGTGSVCPRQEDEPQTCGQWGYLPIESIPYDYDVISTLTGRGYIIIEAAGNGEQRIDRVPGRDSGAIMVGSSDPITHIPSWFTNFGSRVDVHAWGAGIATLGYGEDPARRPNSAMRADGRDYRQWYTGDFGGTSGASPIVAGAAAIIQSNRRARGARDLDSRTMRSLLASTGTPQHTDMRQIGPQPDLRKALAASATLSAQR
jgi:subtilisin family serine protease